jgi:WD40 repeat protein
MPYGNSKSSLAFSPDSKLLAVTEELPAPTPNDGTWPKSKTRLNVWEITDNGRVFTLNEQSTLTLNLTGVDFIEFFPNSRKLLVVQSDRGTERGDRDDSTRLIFVDRIAPHITDSPLVWRGLSKSVTLSKDGKYVAVVNADSLNVIDTESSGERVKKYGGSVYLHWFYAAVFSPDSRKLAVVQTTGEIKFIDPSTGKEVSSLPAGLKKAVHSEDVFLRFSPDGNLLVEKDGDNYIRVWNVVDRKELYTYYGNLRADIADIGFSKTGKIMAVGSSDSSVTLWRVEPEYTVVTGNLVSFRPVFSPDGKTIAIKKRIPVKRKAVTDRTQAPVVDLLDLETLNLRARFPIRFLARSTFAQGNSVAFSPDGKTLAVGGLDGIIELWDLLTNKKKHEFRGLDSGHIEGVKINNIGFTEDGSRLSAHNRLGLMKVWDLVTGKVLLRKENVFGLAFSSRKKRMAVATTDGTVELKETLDFRTLRMFKNDKRASLQFLPDGNTLAIFGKRETIPAVLDFKFIDAENGRIKIHRQQPYIKPIKSFSFTPDGKTMATGLADGTVKLWSLSNFEELISLKIGDEYSEGVSVEFSPDGRFMSIGNPFGTRLGLLRAAAKEKVSAKQ